MRYLKKFEDIDIQKSFDDLQKAIDHYGKSIEHSKSREAIEKWEKEIEEELESELEEKQPFVDEVRALFDDLVVDVFNYEELPDDLDENEKTYGLFYDVYTFYLRRSNKIDINIYVGKKYIPEFKKSKSGIKEFLNRLEHLGYRYEYDEELMNLYTWGDRRGEIQVLIEVYF